MYWVKYFLLHSSGIKVRLNVNTSDRPDDFRTILKVEDTAEYDAHRFLYSSDTCYRLWLWCCGVLSPGRMPTVVSPDLYRSRFCEAMDKYFLMVPDHWTSLGMNCWVLRACLRHNRNTQGAAPSSDSLCTKSSLLDGGVGGWEQESHWVFVQTEAWLEYSTVSFLRSRATLRLRQLRSVFITGGRTVVLSQL